MAGTTLAPDPLPSVPTMLKEIPNWVSWKLINGDKPLYIVGTDRYASSTDSSTWTDFGTAVTKTPINGVEGIGFVISGLAVEKEIVGVDIDGCLNPKTDEIAPWAEKIVDSLDSYTERTPSGLGLRVWVTGQWPFKEHVFNLDPEAGFGDKVKIEVYTRARYYTITGDAWYDCQVEIERRDLRGFHSLCRDIQSQWTPKAKTTSTSPSSIGEGIRIESAPAAPITDKYELLMHGIVSGDKPLVIADGFGNSLTYNDRSAADMALCTASALKRGDNPDAIWKDYENSCLFRPKWENREDDFRRLTIANAIATVKNMKDTPSGASSPNPGTCDEPSPVEFQEPELPRFPRLSGILTELADAVCPDIPYEFKIGAALAHFGLIRSGLDKFEGEPNLQPRFYICLVKEPGYGKTAAINEMRECMKACNVTYSSMPSIDSGPALVDEFAELRTQMMLKNVGVEGISSFPSRVLLDPDEMIDLFEKSKVTPNGRNSLYTEMYKLYESNRTGNRSRKAGKSQLDDAYLAIIGGATPDGYDGMWLGTGGGSKGLKSRFIPITTTNGKIPVTRRLTNMTALGTLLPALHKLANQPGVEVSLGSEARKMLEDWWEAKGDDRDKPSHTRIDDMVKRLLLVTGPTSGHAIINKDLMVEALSWGDYIIAAREKFNNPDAFTPTQAREDDIRRVMRRHGVAMTQNQCRRLVHPDRKPGGVGPYIAAWKNLIFVGELYKAGVNLRGADTFLIQKS